MCSFSLLCQRVRLAYQSFFGFSPRPTKEEVLNVYKYIVNFFLEYQIPIETFNETRKRGNSYIDHEKKRVSLMSVMISHIPFAQKGANHISGRAEKNFGLHIRTTQC